MSREIELKIPLTQEEFSEIKDFITSRKKIPSLSFHSIEKIFKSDEYYSFYETHEERIKNNELRVIRIRTEKISSLEPSGIDMHGENVEKSFFCIKQKTLENGVEFNSEQETFIESPEVLRAFFQASGYKKWFEKTKDSLSVFASLSGFEAHFELEKVNGLPYAEIEYTREDLKADEVRINLEKILCLLGLDPKKRDSRSWAEILVYTEKSSV